MAKYIIYFDSGTSNSRIYLLDENLNQVCMRKRTIGSKDSAAAGTNEILLQNLKEMHDEVLVSNQITDEDVSRIFASGMLTTPYGIVELPHVVIPVTVEKFAKTHPSVYEGKFFKREIELIPGLKTIGDEIAKVNNMRGEEIEIMGAMEHFPEECNGKSIALVMPGSHTHTALIKNKSVEDILSTFSGELFYALKKSTVIAPVLSAKVEQFDREQVIKGYENLVKYGFNRAIYIVHAMRMFHEGTEAQRVSYAEGVIMGDIINALDQKCEECWTDCEIAVIVCTKEIYDLFEILFTQSKRIKKLIWLPIDDQTSYAVEGLRQIIKNS